jgi:hypothetical protein
MINENLVKDIASKVIERLDEIASSIDHASTPTVADGTNWTEADSLSNISFHLEEISETLKVIAAKMK